MIYFLDASALAKRYIEEPGSHVVRALWRRGATIGVSRLSQVEVPAALARRARKGDLSELAARQHAARLARDLLDLDVVEPRGKVLEVAADLVWRRALRAYDALQLAAAVHLRRTVGRAVTFLCADAALVAAARAEGLRTLHLK